MDVDQSSNPPCIRVRYKGGTRLDGNRCRGLEGRTYAVPIKDVQTWGELQRVLGDLFPGLAPFKITIGPEGDEIHSSLWSSFLKSGLLLDLKAEAERIVLGVRFAEHTVYYVAVTRATLIRKLLACCADIQGWSVEETRLAHNGERLRTYDQSIGDWGLADGGPHQRRYRVGYDRERSQSDQTLMNEPKHD